MFNENSKEFSTTEYGSTGAYSTGPKGAIIAESSIKTLIMLSGEGRIGHLLGAVGNVTVFPRMLPIIASSSLHWFSYATRFIIKALLTKSGKWFSISLIFFMLFFLILDVFDWQKDKWWLKWLAFCTRKINNYWFRKKWMTVLLCNVYVLLLCYIVIFFREHSQIG